LAVILPPPDRASAAEPAEPFDVWRGGLGVRFDEEGHGGHGFWLLKILDGKEGVGAEKIGGMCVQRLGQRYPRPLLLDFGEPMVLLVGKDADQPPDDQQWRLCKVRCLPLSYSLNCVEENVCA
jgi:hypothetical protein